MVEKHLQHDTFAILNIYDIKLLGKARNIRYIGGRRVQPNAIPRSRI